MAGLCDRCMTAELDAARAECRNLRSLVEQAISCLRMGRYTQMADELRAGLKATAAPARPDLERAVGCTCFTPGAPYLCSIHDEIARREVAATASPGADLDAARAEIAKFQWSAKCRKSGHCCALEYFGLEVSNRSLMKHNEKIQAKESAARAELARLRSVLQEIQATIDDYPMALIGTFKHRVDAALATEAPARADLERAVDCQCGHSFWEHQTIDRHCFDCSCFGYTAATASPRAGESES